ncbi:MAG: hypothetical protein HUJ31_04845, partial [Pseudomonadales bacterium]|nr:hypothetical protein [Pseudomonadales bacterium]
AHEALKERSARWVAAWLRNRVDPMRTTTSMGEIGERKLSDAILFRVQGMDGDHAPRLLQEASYDLPSGTDWMAMTPSFETVPHADDFIWHIGEPGPGDRNANIYLEFSRSHALVPVPPGVTRVVDLPAQNIRASQYGSIQGAELVPSPRYQVSFNANDNLNSEPEPSDLFVPEEYLGLMEEVTRDVSVNGPVAALAYVRRFFGDFRYSLYQKTRQSANPLEYFLLHSRQGHCEHFASATTLMLRQLGIPSRYVVGYSIQEYHSSIGMHVVRQRHAHAWSIAFVDGRWQVVDTTPPIWAEAEAASSGLLRPAQDFLSNQLFLFQLWWNDQQLEDYQIELFILGAILAVVLIWRIYTSEQVILQRDADETAEGPTSGQGLDSPFFTVQQALEEAGFQRGKGEALSRWLRRIDRGDLMPLLKIHNRWRFDPRGIDDQQKALLEAEVQQWLATHESEGSSNA